MIHIHSDYSTQIIINNENENYYITLARCPRCDTKTYHFVWIRDNDLHNAVARCMEHSFIDELERLRMFKDGRLRALSLDISIDPEKHTIFYDYGLKRK